MCIFTVDDEERKTKKVSKQPRKPKDPKGIEKETEEIRETQMFIPPNEQDLVAPPPLEPTVIEKELAPVPSTIIDPMVILQEGAQVPDIFIQDQTIIQPDQA